MAAVATYRLSSAVSSHGLSRANDTAISAPPSSVCVVTTVSQSVVGLGRQARPSVRRPAPFFRSVQLPTAAEDQIRERRRRRRSGNDEQVRRNSCSGVYRPQSPNQPKSVDRNNQPCLVPNNVPQTFATFLQPYSSHTSFVRPAVSCDRPSPARPPLARSLD